MINISRRALARYAADQLLGSSESKDLARQLAAVLIATRKTGQADLLISDISWELEARGKSANATVTSATELSEKLRTQIKAFIKKSAKVEDLSLEERIDESVIGGVRIETAAHSWDKTIANQLNNLREAF